MEFAVRIHGRGGQGVVTAAELLSVAAFDEGRHALAFPTFGSERTGAPVVSFCRISDEPIRAHEPIAHPNAVIIGDPTLLHQVDVFGGLDAAGYALINTGRGLAELGIEEFGGRIGHLATVAATEIAQRHVGKPKPNAALLGAFAALTGVLPLEAVQRAIRERFPGPVGDANVAAAAEGFRKVAREQLAVADA
jgi:pyruvate ferredoxin oxidoreductase gamma subunit